MEVCHRLPHRTGMIQKFMCVHRSRTQRALIDKAHIEKRPHQSMVALVPNQLDEFDDCSLVSLNHSSSPLKNGCAHPVLPLIQCPLQLTPDSQRPGLSGALATSEITNHRLQCPTKQQAVIQQADLAFA